jgi:hypothetical protein
MTFLDEEAGAVRVYTSYGTQDLSAADLNNSTALRAKVAACAGEGLASTH